jgi:hypothetical protein
MGRFYENSPEYYSNCAAGIGAGQKEKSLLPRGEGARRADEGCVTRGAGLSGVDDEFAVLTHRRRKRGAPRARGITFLICSLDEAKRNPGAMGSSAGVSERSRNTLRFFRGTFTNFFR